jgi:hypothetical protein
VLPIIGLKLFGKLRVEAHLQQICQFLANCFELSHKASCSLGLALALSAHFGQNLITGTAREISPRKNPGAIISSENQACSIAP